MSRHPAKISISRGGLQAILGHAEMTARHAREALGQRPIWDMAHAAGVEDERKRLLDSLPARITGALARIEVAVHCDGPMAHKVIADDLAAAIVEVLREETP